MRRFSSLCLAGLLPVLSLMAQNPVPVPAGGTNAPATAGATNAPTLVPADGIDAESRELKPGDVLRFVIEQDPSRNNYNQQVFVSEAGEALFPISRGSSHYVKLLARGKKLADIRREVKTLLDAEFYQDCTLQIDLDLIRRDPATVGTDNLPKVTVFGAMQGNIVLREGEVKTLSDIILQLGKNDYANLRRVKIRRLDPETKREDIKEYNVKEILEKGDRSKDPEVKDGDRIEVPEKGFNF